LAFAWMIHRSGDWEARRNLRARPEISATVRMEISCNRLSTCARRDNSRPGCDPTVTRGKARQAATSSLAGSFPPLLGPARASRA
jgi:hypothetical protein